MDEDILFAMLGNITQKLSDIKSDVGSIRLSIPDEDENTYIESKLDRIIELLEEIASK